MSGCRRRAITISFENYMLFGETGRAIKQVLGYRRNCRKPKSEEEIACEAHFVKNISRDYRGRYIVRVPFRDINKQLGESQMVALKRLSSLERKFNVDTTLRNEYESWRNIWN